VRSIVFNLFPFIILFASCSGGANDQYVLPKEVHLNSYNFFDPLYADHIVESPLKNPFFWNDSLIELCGIKRIEIILKGNKRPDDLAERHEYNYGFQGETKSFLFYNFEFTDKIYSEVSFKYAEKQLTRLDSPIFLGEKSNQSLFIHKNKGRTECIRKRNGSEGDTTFVYYKNNKPQIIIEKLGQFVSKIHFYINIDQPVNVIRTLMKDKGISPEEFLLAEKTMTFIEDEMPVKSFMLNEELVKGDLTEEWIYENGKKLTQYKKYINNTCVKDVFLKYSPDKLLRSFDLNRKHYEIIYF
jgi:hypothetical protein